MNHSIKCLCIYSRTCERRSFKSSMHDTHTGQPQSTQTPVMQELFYMLWEVIHVLLYDQLSVWQDQCCFALQPCIHFIFNYCNCIIQNVCYLQAKCSQSGFHKSRSFHGWSVCHLARDLQPVPCAFLEKIEPKYYAHTCCTTPLQVSWMNIGIEKEQAIPANVCNDIIYLVFNSINIILNLYLPAIFAFCSLETGTRPKESSWP